MTARGVFSRFHKDINMKKQMLLTALLVAGSVTGAMAQASGESPWQVRLRSVHLDSVNKDGIVAGCHHISFEEIERLAKKEGVK
jgi:hypothetical protein